MNRLREKGHEVVAASPDTGVNTITGEGLAEALEGARVVVDLANSPSFEDKAALEFFETSGRNLLAAEAAAGGAPSRALGRRRRPPSRKRLFAREDGPGEPDQGVRNSVYDRSFHAILRVHRPHRRIRRDGNVIRLSPALLQPIASDDVADAMADAALGAPVNGTIEIAGPEPWPLDKLARSLLNANGDRREVIADVHARYYGTELNDQSLTPGDHPRLGSIRFEDWLSRSPARR